MSEAKKFFNSLAEQWDHMAEHDPKKLNAILALSGVKPGMRVLDIACGTGVLFPWLLGADIAYLLGVDIADKMIERARVKTSDPRVALRAEDFFAVKDSGFHVAFLYSAYPHFPDKARLARHLADRLADGGRFLLAHSQSRDAINARHQGHAGCLSTALLSAAAECAHFAPYFAIDVQVDTPELYVISGTKKD